MTDMHFANLRPRSRRGNGGTARFGSALAALALLTGHAGEDVWVEREAFLMGTTFRAYVGARDAQHGFAAIETAFAEVRRLDSLLSSWRDDSAISALNRSPIGRAVPLAPELYAILVEARGWHQATGGAFDPGVGALTDAWDLRGAGRHPTPEQLATARAASGLDKFAFEDDARVVRRTVEGSWFDAGGFGKGLALRNARLALREAGVGSAMLNFGGQILAVGSNEAGEPWRVTIAHPSRRRSPAAVLSVRDASVSTSSQSERFVTLYGARFGHVIDPRNGDPVPPWGSVTVVAEDPAWADVVSTALFVMGPDAGMAWIAEHPEVGALFLIERNGRLETRMNATMRPYVVRAP